MSFVDFHETVSVNQLNPPQLTTGFRWFLTKNQRNPPILVTFFTETDQKSPKPTSIDHYFYQNRPKINETDE